MIHNPLTKIKHHKHNQRKQIKQHI